MLKGMGFLRLKVIALSPRGSRRRNEKHEIRLHVGGLFLDDLELLSGGTSDRVAEPVSSIFFRMA